MIALPSFPQHALRRAALALALPLALVAGPAGAADPSEFSEAEKLVFVESHLSNLKAPAKLQYSFVKSGSLEPGFSDEVSIAMNKQRNVQGLFLSGERRVSLPEIERADANPVILFFLEHDIREMERLTKGKSGYFRKRIRMAMVDQAVVRNTRISYNGSEVDAQEVSLSPYAQDPMRSRYERYADKRYTFVLSKAVPGGVYQVRTALPGALASDAPVLEEVMTLAGPAARTAAAASPNKPAPTR